jgi:hypothetical protein
MRQELSKDRVLKKAYIVPAFIILSLPALLVFFFSDATYTFFEQDESQLRFSLKHPGKIKQKCTEEEIKAFQEEMEKKLKHMRMTEPVCGRERFPVYVEVFVDNRQLLSREYMPRGLSGDMPSFAYEVISIEPGSHEILVKMRDSGRTEGFDKIFRKRDVNFRPGYVVVIDFDEVKEVFFQRS